MTHDAVGVDVRFDQKALRDPNQEPSAAPEIKISTSSAVTDSPLIFLASGSEGYGIQRAFLGLAGALTRSGQPPVFALLSRSGLDSALESEGVSVICPPGAKPMPHVAGSGWQKYLRLCRRAANQLRLVPWLAREVRRRSARTMIVRSPMEVALAAVVAWRTGITAFWMMPNTVASNYPLDINRRIYRFLFRHMNLVPIANSHYTATTLGDGDFQRHVVHLGIDLSVFSPDGPASLRRQDIGIPSDAVVLGIFARMVREKGQAVVVEALAKLGEDGRQVHLLLCGGPLEGAFINHVRESAAALGLAGHIHIVGPVKDVVPYYQVCDVVVNSRLDPEPFGFSVIEGMAMGKPVLAHRAGGPGETVIDGVTGWLLDLPTPDGFATALRRMLADRARWPAMSHAARDHAVANFSNDRMLRDLTRIFQAG